MNKQTQSNVPMALMSPGQLYCNQLWVAISCDVTMANDDLHVHMTLYYDNFWLVAGCSFLQCKTVR